MENHYSHMQRDLERDLADYITGLWHLHKINKMTYRKPFVYKSGQVFPNAYDGRNQSNTKES
jgi:dTDP-4-dehydrorhamnose 3,5-epimerase-like enzyme